MSVFNDSKQHVASPPPPLLRDRLGEDSDDLPTLEEILGPTCTVPPASVGADPPPAAIVCRESPPPPPAPKFVGPDQLEAARATLESPPKERSIFKNIPDWSPFSKKARLPEVPASPESKNDNAQNITPKRQHVSSDEVQHHRPAKRRAQLHKARRFRTKADEEEAARLMHPCPDQSSADQIERYVQFMRNPDLFTTSEADDIKNKWRIVPTQLKCLVSFQLTCAVTESKTSPEDHYSERGSAYETDRFFQFLRYPDCLSTFEADEIRAKWRPIIAQVRQGAKTPSKDLLDDLCGLQWLSIHKELRRLIIFQLFDAERHPDV